MRIICPTCACHYEVDADRIAASGQLVRCAECRDVWLVRPSDEPARPGSDLAAPRPAAATPAPLATGDVAAATRGVGYGEPPIDFAKARSRLRRHGPSEGVSRQRGSTGTVLAAAAVVAAMAGVAGGFRVAIVSRVPQAAFAAIGLPTTPDGLAFQDVRSVVSAEGGQTVLDLHGRIANLQDKAAAVPDLTVVVRDTRAVPLYSWNTAAPKPRLAAGESVAFSTRLAAPPAGGKDVRVSFAELAPPRR